MGLCKEVNALELHLGQSKSVSKGSSLNIIKLNELEKINWPYVL